VRGRGAAGATVSERARVVVGADGLRSRVADRVDAERYRERAPLCAGYYSYWSGLPMGGRFEAYDRGDRSWAVWPTHDDWTLIVVGWPIAQFEQNRDDLEGNLLRALDRAPEFAERVRAAHREERIYGLSVPNYFRKPFGPGWALVGDAGYNRDFMTAQGISDAFLDAESCAAAIDRALSGAAPYDEAMAEYQRARDARVDAMYEFTCEFASFRPPPPERLQLFGAMPGNREAMDGFARTIAGVTSPAEFFAPANVERILAAAAGNRTDAAPQGRRPS
jgi:2-polyprenyl-6-methoxyphenol hydroxylase-like FAD-dependent oxidoreductase